MARSFPFSEPWKARRQCGDLCCRVAGVVPHGLSSGLEKDHSGDVVDGVVEEGVVAGIGVQNTVCRAASVLMSTSRLFERPTRSDPMTAVPGKDALARAVVFSSLSNSTVSLGTGSSRNSVASGDVTSALSENPRHFDARDGSVTVGEVVHCYRERQWLRCWLHVECIQHLEAECLHEELVVQWNVVSGVAEKHHCLSKCFCYPEGIVLLA